VISSVPITAADDEKAWTIAVEHAHSLFDAGGRSVIGHLELLGAVGDGALEIVRSSTRIPCWSASFLPDWKP
jgi:hypothetical protein